jgi:multidrug resistance efflux pump
MEILITLAYIFFIWLLHFKFKLLRFSVWVGVFYFLLYGFALLVDIVVLGQVTPYSSEAAVDGITLQLQPKWAGYIKDIHIKSNIPIKKGEPIITMNPHQWEQRLKKNQAELPRVLKRYKEALSLTPSGAMSEQELIFRKADVDKLKAEISLAQFNLKNTTTIAPTNGYIPILFLKPNMYLSLWNRNCLPFICTDDLWIVAKLKQQSVQYVKNGDPAEITLEMYPGKIINGKVDEIIWAQGNVQFYATSAMPKTTNFTPSEEFFVKIKVNSKEKLPLRYGASGKIVIYTKKAFDICTFIRQIEIRCDAFLHYIYNPFR